MARDLERLNKELRALRLGRLIEALENERTKREIGELSSEELELIAGGLGPKASATLLGGALLMGMAGTAALQVHHTRDHETATAPKETTIEHRTSDAPRTFGDTEELEEELQALLKSGGTNVPQRALLGRDETPGLEEIGGLERLEALLAERGKQEPDVRATDTATAQEDILSDEDILSGIGELSSEELEAIVQAEPTAGTSATSVQPAPTFAQPAAPTPVASVKTGGPGLNIVKDHMIPTRGHSGMPREASTQPHGSQSGAPAPDEWNLNSSGGDWDWGRDLVDWGPWEGEFLDAPDTNSATAFPTGRYDAGYGDAWRGLTLEQLGINRATAFPTGWYGTDTGVSQPAGGGREAPEANTGPGIMAQGLDPLAGVHGMLPRQLQQPKTPSSLRRVEMASDMMSQSAEVAGAGEGKAGRGERNVSRMKPAPAAASAPATPASAETKPAATPARENRGGAGSRPNTEQRFLDPKGKRVGAERVEELKKEHSQLYKEAFAEHREAEKQAESLERALSEVGGGIYQLNRQIETARKNGGKLPGLRRKTTKSLNDELQQKLDRAHALRDELAEKEVVAGDLSRKLLEQKQVLRGTLGLSNAEITQLEQAKGNGLLRSLAKAAIVAGAVGVAIVTAVHGMLEGGGMGRGGLDVFGGDMDLGGLGVAGRDNHYAAVPHVWIDRDDISGLSTADWASLGRTSQGMYHMPPHLLELLRDVEGDEVECPPIKFTLDSPWEGLAVPDAVPADGPQPAEPEAAIPLAGQGDLMGISYDFFGSYRPEFLGVPQPDGIDLAANGARLDDEFARYLRDQNLFREVAGRGPALLDDINIPFHTQELLKHNGVGGDLEGEGPQLKFTFDSPWEDPAAPGAVPADGPQPAEPGAAIPLAGQGGFTGQEGFTGVSEVPGLGNGADVPAVDVPDAAAGMGDAGAAVGLHNPQVQLPAGDPGLRRVLVGDRIKISGESFPGRDLGELRQVPLALVALFATSTGEGEKTVEELRKIYATILGDVIKEKEADVTFNLNSPEGMRAVTSRVLAKFTDTGLPAVLKPAGDISPGNAEVGALPDTV